MPEDSIEDFDWGQLGEAWWADAGKQLGSEPKQLKFAAAKHRGCSNTEAARQAGYKTTDPDAIRSTGYRLARANITERLLALAVAESNGEGYDGSVDAAESRRILSSLARGSDPNIRIRACEALAKMDERQHDLGQAQDQDGLTEDRLVRSLLQMPGGAAAAVCLQMGSGVAISRIALLHDVHKACMADPMARANWDLAVKKCSEVMQQDLRELLAKPGWQFHDRQKLWREVGVEIDVPQGTDLTPPTQEESNGETT